MNVTHYPDPDDMAVKQCACGHKYAGWRSPSDPDPLYVPEPGTDDEPWTVSEPDQSADRRSWAQTLALAVLIVALVVVAIAWQR